MTEPIPDLPQSRLLPPEVGDAFLAQLAAATAALKQAALTASPDSHFAQHMTDEDIRAGRLGLLELATTAAQNIEQALALAIQKGMPIPLRFFDTDAEDDPEITTAADDFDRAVQRLNTLLAHVGGRLLESDGGTPNDSPVRKRRKITPRIQPLAFPNEPGYRALLYTATQESSVWEATPAGLTLRTAVAGPDKELLSVIMGGVEDHPNALSAALGLLPHSEDGTALKVLIALPSLFFDHNPHATYNEVYETTIPDLMRYMGFKAKHGAFERDDQERVWRAICLLNRLWIPGVTWRTKKSSEKEVTGQGSWFSPVIVLQGIQQGVNGIGLPQGVRYSLGKDFHAYYNGDAGKRTRMLTISPKIMELHGRRDINLLRLAVYYASQGRINKEGLRRGAQQFDFKYSTLLVGAGIPIDKANPKRQFGRVLSWHDELATKGLIGDYIVPTPPPAGSPYKDYAKLIFWISPVPTPLLPGV